MNGMVHRRVECAVTCIDRRVVYAPAVKQRAVHLPATAVVIPPQQEQSLTRAYQGQDADSHEPNAPAGSRTAT